MKEKNIAITVLYVSIILFVLSIPYGIYREYIRMKAWIKIGGME